jgi:uncharacterized protein
MLTVARTTVPIAVAGLLLTACGGGKGDPTSLPKTPNDRNLIGVAPNSAATSMGGTGTMGGTGMMSQTGTGGAAIDVGAPMASAMKPGLPVAATVAPLLSADTHTLATRGVGKASGSPDTLTVMIGVSTQGSSARAALNANNAKANALLAVLRGKGVADKDLQTRQLTINPTYDDKSNTITGYQVDNVVQATLHSLGNAGALLDAAAGAVGNAVRVQQIGFSIGDDSALRAQARAQAVEQARAQAAQLAKAAGVTLGRIRSITEIVDAGYPVNYDMRSAAGASAAVPLQPGQQELSVSVDIIYDIS